MSQSIDASTGHHPFDVPGTKLAGVNFADVAIELKLCELDSPQLSYALLLETLLRADRVRAVEQLAARIGLDAEIARRIVVDARRRVDLLAAAHLTFKALIPHEATLRRLLVADAEWRAQFGITG